MQVESWAATVEKEEGALASIGQKCKTEQESIETEVAVVREEIAAADERIAELEKGVALTQVCVCTDTDTDTDTDRDAPREFARISTDEKSELRKKASLCCMYLSHA